MLQKLVSWVNGKKVYILAATGAVAGLVQFISTGDFSLGAIVALGKAEWVMALLACFRHAVAKSGSTTPVTPA